MDNKIFVLSFVLLALCSISFCDDCDENSSNCVPWTNEPAIDPIKWNTDDDSGGYVEQVTIRVLDEKGRTVQGALVNITWEITRARGKATTKTLSTNEQGRVSFTLTNLEYDPEDTDKTYIVRVKYGTELVQRTFSAINGKVEQTIVLPVYEIRFFVRDKNSNPLANIPISIGQRSTTTSKNGVAYAVLESGTHTAIAQYADLAQPTTLVVSGRDLSVNITLELFNLAVNTIDDLANPISAQVNIGSQTIQTNQSGWANFENLTSKDLIVYALYDKYKKTQQVDASRSDVATIVFDLSPPIISDIVANIHTDGNLLVRATIKDPGEYASGLGGENASIVIIYTDSQDEQKRLPMYSVGYNIYEGIIPTFADQASVRYSIYAMDASSNSASSSDLFVIQNEQSSGFDIPSSEKIPDDLDVSAQPIRLDWAFVPIVIATIIALAVVGYWYYNNKKPPSAQKEQVTVWKKTDETNTQSSTSSSSANSLDSIPKKDTPPKPPSLPQ